MSMIRCSQCQRPLIQLRDGTAWSCRGCGKTYSPEQVRGIKALISPCVSAEDWMNRAQKALEDLPLTECPETSVTELSKSYERAYDLADGDDKEALIMPILNGLWKASDTLANPTLWRPLLLSMGHCRKLLGTERFHNLMGHALENMVQTYIQPAEDALLDWHQASGEQTLEDAFTLLQLCNEATDHALTLLGCGLSLEEDILLHEVLSRLLTRMDRLTWDMEDISCSRKSQEDPKKLETFRFFSTSDYLPEKNTLGRSRGLINNYQTQLKQHYAQYQSSQLEAYWNQRPQEKEQLQERWVELRMEIARLKRLLSICPEIERMRMLQHKINAKEEQLSALSIFRQRERNALKDEQTALRQEFAQADEAFNQQVNDITSQIALLDEELQRVIHRLKLDP